MFPVLKYSHFIGLDISSDEIRLLRVKRRRKILCIENFAFQTLPQGAIVDGRIRQFDVVQNAVSRLVHETRSRGCQAAIALPASSIISKRIRLSGSLGNAECEAEITANFNKYFPGILEELCFDFIKLEASDDSQHEILLAASRSEQLNTYLGVVNESGLKIKIVDVDSYALVRAGNFLYPEAAAMAVLHAAADVTQFLIFQRHNIIYSNQWPTGDAEFQDAQVKRALQLNLSAHPGLRIKYYVFAGKNLGLSADINMTAANPFYGMRLAPQLGRAALYEAAPRFMLACGLALRSLAHARN